jgi:predicted phosphodiesterase
MNEKMVFFGDLHLEEEALSFILQYASRKKINVVLNLGDESDFEDSPIILENIYKRLMKWRDKSSDRRLICVVGDQTEDVIPKLRRNYVGMDENGEVIENSIFKESNLIAVHSGQDVERAYSELLRSYHNTEPLLVLHGDVHAMSVYRQYRWLDDWQKVRFIKNGERQIKLKRGLIYWISPGCALWEIYKNHDFVGNAINFGIYDPKEKKVTLKSVVKPYQKP